MIISALLITLLGMLPAPAPLKQAYAQTDILVEVKVTVTSTQPVAENVVNGPYTIILVQTTPGGGEVDQPDQGTLAAFELPTGSRSVSSTLPLSGPYAEAPHYASISLTGDLGTREVSLTEVLDTSPSGTPNNDNVLEIFIDENSPLFGNSGFQETPEQEQIDRSCFAGGLLGWILCPLIKGLFEFIEFIYRNVILTSLVIDPLDPDSTDPATVALFEIWNNFRVIANVLLFIIFLLAIFGQGLAGFHVFSAYEFKKIIPRLVIGTIAVQLSFYMVAFAVDAFNVMGAGIRGLILAPVEGYQWGDFNFGASSNFIQAVLGGSTAWIARYAVGKIGFMYALPLILIPIVIALLTTMLVLLFRKMIIFLLIVVSPVAFVMGILPGFDKWLKQWWDLLWKALFMFPLIIAFIASGELVAKVLVAGNEASAANQVMGIIALFAPYFLIPATFKLAGNAVGAIAGGVNNMSGGLKNKILGEAHDSGSIRGRARKARQDNRDNRKTAWAQRNRPGAFTIPRLRDFRKKQVRKDFRTGVAAGVKGGWGRDSMERKVPTKAGNILRHPIKGWSMRNAGGPARNAGIAGVLGGVVASMATRAKWIDPATTVGARMFQGLQAGKDLMENNDAMGLALYRFPINPSTGGAVDIEYEKEVMKGQERDSGLMAGVLVQGFETAGTEEVVHVWREQLKQLRSDGVIDHTQADVIWNTATYAVRHTLPNIQNMNLETGEWDRTLIPEGLQKDEGRAGFYQRMNYRELHWSQQRESFEALRNTLGNNPNIPDSEKIDAPSQLLEETKLNFDRDRLSIINDLQRSLQFSPTREYQRVQQSIEDERKQRVDDAIANNVNPNPNDLRQVNMKDVFDKIRATPVEVNGKMEMANAAATDDILTLQMIKQADDPARYRNQSQLPHAYWNMLDYLENSYYFDQRATDLNFSPQVWLNEREGFQGNP